MNAPNFSQSSPVFVVYGAALIAAISSSVGRAASGRHVSADADRQPALLLQLAVERDLLRVHGAVVDRRQPRGDVPLELIFERLQAVRSR